LIVRILRGRVRAEQVLVFHEQARLILEDARRHAGLVHAQVGRQVHSDGAEEIVFVSIWRDLEGLYTWVGGTDLLDTPVLNGSIPNLFDHLEVQHYQTYDLDEPEPAGAADEAGGVGRERLIG
jgi:hypothetical protein